MNLISKNSIFWWIYQNDLLKGFSKIFYYRTKCICWLNNVKLLISVLSNFVVWNILHIYLFFCCLHKSLTTPHLMTFHIWLWEVKSLQFVCFIAQYLNRNSQHILALLFLVDFHLYGFKYVCTILLFLSPAFLYVFITLNVALPQYFFLYTFPTPLNFLFRHNINFGH